uniref:GP-PDE domain-containing protein n=1 Tax=Denticeps clupeoides TaxID=299321 RepID=A0AAY4DGU7_9TELE
VRTCTYILFLILLMLYVLVSVCLLKNPLILHKKKHQAFHSRRIACRKMRGAFIKPQHPVFSHSAVSLGAEMLELDCHLTKDGHVVVSHDANLKRQTGYDIEVSSLNVQDLPLYREKLEVTFYAGRYSTGEDRKLALLEDVFRKFPNMPVNVEVKEEKSLLIKNISYLAIKYKREDITVWASESSSIIAKCRKENPRMPYMFSYRRGFLLLLLFYTGLLPFVPLGESLLQCYLFSVFNRSAVCLPFFFIQDSYSSHLNRLTMKKALISHLVKRGFQVQLFVCNEESDVKKALALGATGVMSDYPSLLSKVIPLERTE